VESYINSGAARGTDVCTQGSDGRRTNPCRDGRLLDGMMNMKDELHSNVRAYQVWQTQLIRSLRRFLGSAIVTISG
jgi:hypothetical protein